ncbi:endonuclease/exonuclease/phosphatase family protein [Magnetospirillum sulfuroxidans]|uniref:endonuclease/exonuclease/phosphatase family protein n=1 Tax=Magnetospirillum sulfuroxidans TaxID=611300 RepID=UPI0031FECB17
MKRWRLATFNLESLDDRLPGADDFADRVAVLRPQLQRLRADILCLQEINAHTTEGKHGPRSPTGLDRLLDGTPYAGYHRVVSLNRGGQRPADRHNLVILSRFPIIAHGQVWHDLVPPPTILPVTADPPFVQAQAVEWDRPLLHADIDLGHGRVLHVINVHLRAPRAAWLPGQKTENGRWRSVAGWAEGFYLAAVKRAGQALEGRLLVEHIFDAKAEAWVAVCGDFNSDDREAPIRTLRGDEEDTGNGHLAPRVLVPLERGIPESQRFSVVHHGQRVMLDHILVSRPLLGCLTACAVHNEALGDELVSPAAIWGSPDSFHAPLVAEFA